MSHFGPRSSVAILEIDPDLGAGLAPEAFKAASRHFVVPVVSTESSGPIDLPDDLGPDAFGALVLEGVVLHEIEMGGWRTAQLLGPGDLVGPEPGRSTAVSGSVTVDASAGTALAVLGPHALAAMARWPALAANLLRASSAQSERLSAQQAISRLPRVGDRLVAMLWSLAERWGHVRADAVHLPLAMTHDLLGRLVGARRPTVSVALSVLAEKGLVTRQPDRTWLLQSTGGDVPGTALPPLPAVRHRSTVAGLDAAPSGSQRAGTPARAEREGLQAALWHRFDALQRETFVIRGRIEADLARYEATRAASRELRLRTRDRVPAAGALTTPPEPPSG